MDIQWLSECSSDDTRSIGRKAAALAQLDGADLSTPRGFVIPAQVFEQFVRQNDIEQEVQRLLNGTDRNDRSAVQRTANQIRSRVMDASLTDEEREALHQAYAHINMSNEVRNAGEEAAELVGGQRETEFVAVRASPTGERMPGVHHTAVNVNGKDAVVDAVKQTWASLYSAAALRMEPHLGDIHSMAVIVQRMVEPDVSGAVQIDADRSTYCVEALWGLGTALADGNATPDMYTLGQDGTVRSTEIATKGWKVTRDPTSGKTLKQRVPGNERGQRCLDSSALEDVFSAAQTVGERWRGPLQVAFARDRNRTVVLDVTRIEQPATTNGEQESEPLVRGRGTRNGTASGPVTILYSDTETSAIEHGDVVVAVDGAERFIHVLPDIGAFVADDGGITSNLALLAASYGVPYVTGTGNGTDMLTRGETVTVNAITGTVHEGDTETDAEQTDVSMRHSSADAGHLTATQVKAIGQEPHPDAEGVVVPDYVHGRMAVSLAEEHHPEQVWVRTDKAQQPNLGVLEHAGAEDVRGKGVVLQSYGGVLRTRNLVDRQAAFVGLDVDALQADGGREALHNAIEQVAMEAGPCETAVLLPDVDRALIDHAVEHGIDTVAVPPDHVPAARRAVAKAERRFMLDRLRQL